jgi:hypothetical protein
MQFHGAASVGLVATANLPEVIDAGLESARYVCNEARQTRLLAADTRRRAAWERQRAGAARSGLCKGRHQL